MNEVGQSKLGDVPQRVLNIFQDRKNRLICTIEWVPRPLATEFTDADREVARQIGVSLPEEGVKPLDSFEDFKLIYKHYPDLLLDYYRTIIKVVRR